MLRDRYFYPLALLVIAGIITLALSFGHNDGFSDQQIINDGWDISGPDLNSLTVSPGTNSAYVNDEGGYIQLSQYTPDGEGPASIGAFATLGPSHERAFAGRPLRLTFRARSGRINPLSAFDVAYYTMEGPPSGWTTFTLGPDWEDYTVEYTPPIIAAQDNVDLIAIFPGRAGLSETMDLASISVAVLDDRD